jgi:hypothetical protein
MPPRRGSKSVPPSRPADAAAEGFEGFEIPPFGEDLVDTDVEQPPPPSQSAWRPAPRAAEPHGSAAPPSDAGEDDESSTLQARAADAHGQLGPTPLPYMLVSMLDQALSGTLVLRGAEGRIPASIITFVDGAAARVEMADPVALLGDVLVSQRLLTADVVERALEHARRRGVRLGDQLLASGLITQHALERALARQIEHRLAALVNLPSETEYTFHRQDASEMDPTTVVRSDPFNALLVAVRAWNDRPRIQSTLRWVGQRRLAVQAEADLSGLDLSPEEEMALVVIRRENPTFDDLVAMQLADPPVLESLVYVLSVTRQLRLDEDKKPPMRVAPVRHGFASMRPPAPGPVRLSSRPAPPPASSRGVLEEPRLEPPDPLLDSVPLAATDEHPVSPAAWHPAPFESEPPAPLFQPVAAPAPSTPAPSAEAPAHRSVASPPSPPSAHAAPSVPSAPRLSISEEHKVQALTAFALAEAAFARNDMTAAEAHAARAVAGDPARTEYLAFHAWVRAQSGVAKDVPESIRTLNKILEEDPCDERALFYRGKLFRRTGQNKAALKDFVTILYTNPTHKEALAEVRVLRMRHKKS